jgi:hypothetical protein
MVYKKSNTSFLRAQHGHQVIPNECYPVSFTSSGCFGVILPSFALYLSFKLEVHKVGHCRRYKLSWAIFSLLSCMTAV